MLQYTLWMSVCVDGEYLVTWLTEWPERANLPVADNACKTCEPVRSCLSRHPEVSVRLHFWTHRVFSLRRNHAVECAKGSVDCTYDQSSGVMGGELQRCCVIDLLAVSVVAVGGKLRLPSIEFFHQRLSGAHCKSEVVTQSMDRLERARLV